MNKRLHTVISLAFGLLVISLVNFNFNPATSRAAQQTPPPKLANILQVPCEVHTFPRPCTTNDAKPGIQMVRCTDNTWTDVGGCVPLQIQPSGGECIPGMKKFVICAGKNDRMISVIEKCVNGHWVRPADCGLWKAPPTKK